MLRLVTLFLLFITVSAFSQTKSLSIPLSGTDLMFTQNMGPKGLLLKTGNKTKDLKLSYYNEKLELQWEQPLNSNTRFYPYNQNMVVASPDVKYVYHFDNSVGSSLGSAKTFVTQLVDGVIKKEQEIDTKAIGSACITLVDNQRVYIIDGGTIVHSDYSAFPKKEFQMMVLDHKTLSPKLYQLTLPVIPKGRENSSWKLVGIKEGQIYLYSCRINFESKTSEVIIAKVDGASGKVTTQSIKLTTEHYLAANELNNEPFGGHLRGFDDKNLVVGKTTGGAFCGVKLDDQGNFIMYGLTSVTGFTEGKTTFDGYFVHKYDQSGKKLWATENGGGDKLNKHIVRLTNSLVTSLPSDIRIDNNQIHFITISGVWIYEVKLNSGTGAVELENDRALGEISSKGFSQYAKTFSVELTDLWNFLFASTDKVIEKIFDYPKLPTSSFVVAPSSDSAILQVNDIKNSKIDLFLYDN